MALIQKRKHRADPPSKGVGRPKSNAAPRESSTKYLAPGFGNTPLSLREIWEDHSKLLLEMAGVTQAAKVNAIKRAFEVGNEAMEATTVKVFSNKETIIYSKALIDHGTRLKGAELVLPLVGVKLNEVHAPPTVTLNIILPDFSKVRVPKVIGQDNTVEIEKG